MSMESFEQACADIAQKLRIPLATGEEDAAKELVKQHMSAERIGRWLLVLDDADDADILLGARQSKDIIDPMVPSWDWFCLPPARIYDEEFSLSSARNTPVFIGFISTCPRQGLSLSGTRVFTFGDREFPRHRQINSSSRAYKSIVAGSVYTCRREVISWSRAVKIPVAGSSYRCLEGRYMWLSGSQ